MLVLSRLRDEVIEVGSRTDCVFALNPFSVNLLVTLINDSAVADTPQAREVLAALTAAKIGPIEVTVVDVRGDKVRIGVTAPRSLSVHRKEIADAVAREAAAEKAVG